MLIRVSGPSDNSGPPEYTLIELQGYLESKTGEEIAEIGTLCIPKENPDIVTLTIGYHRLEGKRVPLKKPFAILEQFKELDDSVVQKPGTAVQQSGTDIRAEDTSDQMQTEEGAHEAKQPHGNGNVRYEVVGVIRSKILFKTRPTAMISKPQGGRR